MLGESSSEPLFILLDSTTHLAASHDGSWPRFHESCYIPDCFTTFNGLHRWRLPDANNQPWNAARSMTNANPNTH